MSSLLRKTVGVLSVAIYLAAAAFGHALHDHDGCGAGSGTAVCEEQACGCELHRLLETQRPSESSEGVYAGPSSCGDECLACQLMAVLHGGAVADAPLTIDAATSLRASAACESLALIASFAVPSPRGPPAHASRV